MFARISSGSRKIANNLALRRGEFRQEIHALLAPVDAVLTGLVRRGQDSEVFGRHLPPRLLSQMPRPPGRSTGGCRSIRRSLGCISTVRRLRGVRRRRVRTRGARLNYKNRPVTVPLAVEPADHAIGRSRGGLTTKTHALVEGNGRPLVVIVSPGQASDSPVLPKLLAELRVARRGPGRPRTRPIALRADKAYSSRGHRALLRARKITAVIPEPADQAGHRKRSRAAALRRGAGPCRPPSGRTRGAVRPTCRRRCPRGG